MKTKTYDLTAIEVLAIRDALCESKQQWKKIFNLFAIVGREGEK